MQFTIVGWGVQQGDEKCHFCGLEILKIRVEKDDAPWACEDCNGCASCCTCEEEETETAAPALDNDTNR